MRATALDPQRLTPMERIVTNWLVGTALTEKEIGTHLGIRPETVSKHVKGAFRKYGVHSARELILAVRGPWRKNEI